MSTVNTSPAPLAPRELDRLKWRCRRGLLENDLFIDRFFQRHGVHIDTVQAQHLGMLMDLSDHDLLDLLLARKQPEGALDVPGVHALLQLMRAEGPNRPAL